MAITTVDTSNIGTNGVKPRNPSPKLGKDDFLRLLTTQLQNQDPLQPMEDTQFVSQMANYSSLEEMINMRKTLEDFHSAYEGSAKTQAMMYLGTTVTAKGKDMAEAVTGLVEQVGFENGSPYLKIGNSSFKLDEVSSVTIK